VDFSAGENIRDALQRVQSTLNIGLEYMSGGSVTQARKLLRSHHAKDIFRLGFSILVSYARRTRTALRSIELHQEIATLDLVDSPQREILLGLLGDRPQWYEGQTEGGRHRYREFRDLQDIKRLELSLSRLEGIFAVMRGLAGDDYTPVHDDDIAGTNHADPGGLTLSTLFCTALANLLLSERFGIRPLKRSDLTLLGERLQSEGEAEGHNREVRREFMTYTAAACPDLTAAQLERAEEVVLQYLDSLAEELALAGNGDRADLRYLKSLIVSY